jgi:hypothetical protein
MLNFLIVRPRVVFPYGILRMPCSNSKSLRSEALETMRRQFFFNSIYIAAFVGRYLDRMLGRGRYGPEIGLESNAEAGGEAPISDRRESRRTYLGEAL